MTPRSNLIQFPAERRAADIGPAIGSDVERSVIILPVIRFERHIADGPPRKSRNRNRSEGESDAAR